MAYHNFSGSQYSSMFLSVCYNSDIHANISCNGFLTYSSMECETEAPGVAEVVVNSSTGVTTCSILLGCNIIYYYYNK